MTKMPYLPKHKPLCEVTHNFVVLSFFGNTALLSYKILGNEIKKDQPKHWLQCTALILLRVGVETEGYI